jgi:hypothetical protein
MTRTREGFVTMGIDMCRVSRFKSSRSGGGKDCVEVAFDREPPRASARAYPSVAMVSVPLVSGIVRGSPTRARLERLPGVLRADVDRRPGIRRRARCRLSSWCRSAAGPRHRRSHRRAPARALAPASTRQTRRSRGRTHPQTRLYGSVADRAWRTGSGDDTCPAHRQPNRYGRECKLVTGIDDHCRFVVVRSLGLGPSDRSGSPRAG